ncbi:MFS transporter [soil metagenome]
MPKRMMIARLDSGTTAPRVIGLLPLLTTAAAFGVANLYYAQPLVERMATDLQATPAELSPTLVGGQLGYAAGMLLLVPLGDVRERRGVMVTTAFGGALALLAYALAPTIGLLTVASVAIGLGASIVQMILPFAVSLGEPRDRGRIVGNVMGGVLAGILLSRTVSGLLGSVIGWRAVFVCAACVMAVVSLAIRLFVPLSPPTTTLPYRTLLASLGRIFVRERVLRRRAVIGALGFASFMMFWSTIAYQVAHEGIGGSGTAGMLGVIGLTGIVVAPIVGRMAMTVAPAKINLVALGTIALAFAVFALGHRSLVAICVGVVLLDAGCQANHLTNQTVVFGLAPAERNRANAIYMVGYFVGGAGGTAIAAQCWQYGGWTTVCLAGGASSLLAIPALRFQVSKTADGGFAPAGDRHER